MEQTAPPEAALSHREIVIILVGVMLGAFLAALDSTIVAAALPRIAGELGGVEHLSWTITAYLLTSTATTPIYGKLSDIYGRRTLMSAAIVIFVAASLLCALARDLTEMVIARGLQGIGGGGLIVIAQAAIGDILAPRDRPRFQGIVAAMWSIASIGGPIVGGLFAEYLTWRWVFWINLPLGAAAFAMCHTTMRRLPVPPRRRPIDYAGAVLLMAAVTALLLVTAWGGAVLPWTAPEIAGLGVLGLALALAYFFWQGRAAEPILPLRLFRNRVFAVVNLVSFISSMAFLGAIVFIPLHAQLATGASPADAGLLLLPFTGGGTIGAVIGGRIMARSGRYKLLPIVGLALAAGCFGLLAFADAGTARHAMAIYTALAGFGLGCLFPVMIVALQNAVAHQDLGTVTSALSFFRSLGGSYGVAALGALFATGLTGALDAALGADSFAVVRRILHEGETALAQLPEAARAAVIAAAHEAFRPIYLGCAGAAALACLASLFLKELPLRRTLHGKE